MTSHSQDRSPPPLHVGRLEASWSPPSIIHYPVPVPNPQIDRLEYARHSLRYFKFSPIAIFLLQLGQQQPIIAFHPNQTFEIKYLIFQNQLCIAFRCVKTSHFEFQQVFAPSYASNNPNKGSEGGVWQRIYLFYPQQSVRWTIIGITRINMDSTARKLAS